VATFVVADDRFFQHRTGQHPECPERLVGIYRTLRQRRAGQLRGVDPRPATVLEVERVHSRAQRESVEATSRAGGGMLDPDTVCGEESYDVALLAAGAVCALAETLMGEPGRSAGLALVRPPGHHATPDRAMGFCLFNNAAIAARHLQTALGVGRILIVDWDVHHGNGTQDAFYADPSVVYLSMHRWPFYPGTGSESETGAGAGTGATINVPVAAGTPRTEVLARFQGAVEAAARRFAPELVIVSAGFDAYVADPIGGLGLETVDFATMTDIVASVAANAKYPTILSVLEGGYHLQALPSLVAAHVDRLVAFAG